MKWLSSLGRAFISSYKSLLLFELRVLDKFILNYGPTCFLISCKRFLLFQVNILYRLVFTPTNSLV
ncbi:5a protein [Duck coronavirus DK/GD/27/2014]|uniref:5a protein n=1 Tax=Duck coronavirus DK/GD/27/2014 TaxID=2849730 RepID=A0A0F6YS56_9GAMC|nr:5a protein [Duck coronavirus]AKF17730.1 5a protein [Duck coronavirus DK/GD/27/2014]